MAYIGLGAYPTDPCYDPSRPTWLPYWFDDLTESDCKYPSGVLSDLPQAESNITGVVGQTAGAAVADVANAAAAGASSAATGLFAGGTNNITPGGGLMLAAVLVIGMIVLVKK
jgi:hypothetical protein